MIILLDTAEFLWFITGNSRLPTQTEQAIRNPGNAVSLSVVSVWEIINQTRHRQTRVAGAA